MKLCIAEKPSVAKEIARILGANLRRDGYFEGNGYQVSWTFGHLCTLKTPDDYTEQWKRWQLFTLPMIPGRFGIKVIEDSGVKKQFETIQSLVNQCSEVINCGDAGIEGELIQRWVLTKAKCTKPIKRLWISSLTDEAIKEGFSQLKEGRDFDLLYAAGNARSIGDWLLGMNATRLYTLKYANGKGVLSVGRVQTPTLALIVNRHHEIVNFVPQPYWEIKTTYREVVFNATKGRYLNKEEAIKASESIKGEVFTVDSFTRKKGKEAPPKLFDLTSLQVECNKKFGFSADETLQYIQKLYERKLVTYPRVDTSFLPNDIYPKIKGILKNLQPYAKLTAPLTGATIRKSKKVFDDKKITDHHAIIPTGVNPTGLIIYEKQVYDTITRRFIANFYPDCIVSNTTVLGKVAEVDFKATGKTIVDEGWRVVYPKKEQNAGQGQLLPEFSKGESGPHDPDLLEKETQAPKPYTEATLLRAMETAGKQVDDEELRELMKENGIGRPSTRANIIETLFKRRYVQRQRKNLIPTDTGIQLIGTIQNDLLKSVELTGIWERKLRQIENAEYDARQFLDEMKEMVAQLVTEVRAEQYKRIEIQKESKGKKASHPSSRKTKPTVAKKEKGQLSCPRCKKGNIIKGRTAYGCSAYKEGCTFKVAFKQYDKKMSEKQIYRLIEKGKTTALTGFMFNGNKTKGVLTLDEQGNIAFEATQLVQKSQTPPKLICPKCKQGEMLRGKSAYGCSRFREGCGFVIPFDVLQKSYGTEILSPTILTKLT